MKFSQIAPRTRSGRPAKPSAQPAAAAAPAAAAPASASMATPAASAPHYDTIVCLDDLLRDDFWPAKEFIYDLVRTPIFTACGINIQKSPRRGQRSNLLAGFDVAHFLHLCGNGDDADAWQRGYHGVPQAAAAYLTRHLPARALVLSYEMTPWLQQVLDANGTDWIDLRMSPLRFGADLYIGLRTNNPRLYAAAQALSVPANEVAAEAALLAARLRYRLRYEKMSGALDQQCVYIGQTESDASLLKDDGRFARAADHADTLRKLAAAGPLQYKPHPMAGDFAVRERAELERITGQKVLLCEVDTYDLLAREEDILMVGLSSGALQEAVWFGRKSFCLFRPISLPRFDTTFDTEGCLQIASHTFMSQPLWSALTGCEGAQPPVLMPPRANHLRELHNTWWGYSTAVLRHSAFHREAFAIVGGQRQAEALRRCESELAATRAEVAALKAQLGAGPRPGGLPAPAAASAPGAAVNAIADARFDTLRMEIEGLKEALRLLARQAQLQAEAA